MLYQLSYRGSKHVKERSQLHLGALIIKIAGSGSMSVFGSGAARLPGFDEAGRLGQFFKNLSCFLRGQEEKIPRIE